MTYPHPLPVESVDHEAHGIARAEGKTVFIDGALPGEVVIASPYRRKPSFDNAQVVGVVKPSASRVAPRCEHFGVCGGCSMQHADPATQLAIKQRVLEDNLERIGRVRPEIMLRPIAGPTWGYRRRARLSVRHVIKKGGVLVGFHERRSSYVADMKDCQVLPRHIAGLLLPLRALVAGMSIRDRLPQIEVACGDHGDALVFRVLQAPSEGDLAALRAFGTEHQVAIWLQPGGPESATPYWPAGAPDPAYDLPVHQVRVEFKPTDFTQVNHAVNRVLVDRAMQLLDPQESETVADFFCGLGNFTLPIARRARAVTGVEGSAALLARAHVNAQANGLAAKVRWQVGNLFLATAESVASLGSFDKALIDPPREGAIELVKALAAQPRPPRRIVYVSCSPATLARDAGFLVGTAGYRLAAAGVVNMFPHTSHVESVALFEAA
ncbi:MAG: 23S rRNA (uracil(1939)-C(5))-methyltransferase RlmD [Burkholderiales bacterium]|nr:23S rRNA (uracil(1939)-C(5))-methyltransferase RlmD [Burkholderiales bacterium]